MGEINPIYRVVGTAGRFPFCQATACFKVLFAIVSLLRLFSHLVLVKNLQA